MIVSIRMTDEEKELALAYAKLNGLTLSDVIKKSFFEKIEDELDIAVANEVMDEFKKNPKTYSLEEVRKELGL